MELYALLALTLLCGVLVVVGLIGSFQSDPSQGGTAVPDERLADLKHGFVLLGLVTVVLLTVISLLLVRSGGPLPRAGWMNEVRLWFGLVLIAT